MVFWNLPIYVSIIDSHHCAAVVWNFSYAAAGRVWRVKIYMCICCLLSVNLEVHTYVFFFICIVSKELYHTQQLGVPNYMRTIMRI